MSADSLQPHTRSSPYEVPAVEEFHAYSQRVSRTPSGSVDVRVSVDDLFTGEVVRIGNTGRQKLTSHSLEPS